MYQRDDIIWQLGLQDWSGDQQTEAYEMVMYRLGSAIMNQLTDDQQREYELIINDDHATIDAWLANNLPDYENSPIYQAFEAEYENDPEKNNPAKLFASSAWIEAHVSNLSELIEQIIDDYKNELMANQGESMTGQDEPQPIKMQDAPMGGQDASANSPG